MSVEKLFSEAENVFVRARAKQRDVRFRKRRGQAKGRPNRYQSRNALAAPP